MGKDDKSFTRVTTFSSLVTGGGIDANSGPDLPVHIARSLARFCEADPQAREAMLQEMIEELTALRAQKETAEEDSITDALTGVCNRRFFEKSMRDLDNTSPIAKRTPTGRHFLLLIDLDHFKPLNDQHGHAAGDLALQHMSGKLAKLVRKTDILCRIGGDEFAIVLKDATEKGAQRKIAQIVKALQDMSFEFEGKQIAFQGSVGHTEINPSAIRTMEEILKDADRNLYQNKSRNRTSDRQAERQPEPAL